jgi:hypothetical protein
MVPMESKANSVDESVSLKSQASCPDFKNFNSKDPSAENQLSQNFSPQLYSSDSITEKFAFITPNYMLLPGDGRFLSTEELDAIFQLYDPLKKASVEL